MLKKTLFTVLAFSMLTFNVLATTAYASGGYSGGGSRSAGSSPRPQRVIDPVYERGKAVFKGKVRDYGKIKYCLTAPDSTEGAKLRGKNAKAYKGGDASDFAGNLYNCENPDQKIADVLASSDLNAVIYYLNKRFKLKLNS